MNDTVLRLYDQFLREFEPLADAIPADRFDVVAYPGGHDACWIVGHLTVGLDFAGSLLGLGHNVAVEWGKLFGPGSPGHCGESGPSKEELVQSLRRLHGLVGEAMRKADPAVLAQPHGMSFLPADGPLQSMGDLIAYLVTTHAFYHLAQLSSCKTVAAAGRP